jgi:glycosyltransferase involved in cell wall biosynthesis
MIISVALCTCNGESFLYDQLESILSQSLSVNEIVICDDYSTDNTLELVHFYIDKYPGLIHLYQNKKSLGTIKNFEKAISLTKGDLIFLADQDDIWYPDKVEKMVSYFKANKKCKLLFTNGDLINDKGEKLNSTLWEKWKFDEEKKAIWNVNELAFRDMVSGDNKITGATVCFDKILKSVIFPFEFPFGYWHDNWLGVHSAATEGLFFIEDSLIQYRIHQNQQVGLSSSVSYSVNFRANKKFISKEKYLKKLRKKYPYLKEYIPCQKKKVFKRILLKIKRIFNS